MTTNTIITIILEDTLRRAELAAVRRAARVPSAEAIRSALRIPSPARRAAADRLRRISSRATTMYRNWIVNHPEDRGRGTWYEALRQAAREEREIKSSRRVTMDDVRAALAGDTSAQDRVMGALRACASCCPRWAQARARNIIIDAAGEWEAKLTARVGTLPEEEMEDIGTRTSVRVLAPSSQAAWMGTRERLPEAITHIVGEAWTRLPAVLRRAEARGKNAGWVLFAASWSACQAIDREYYPHRYSRRSPEERIDLEARLTAPAPVDPEDAAVARDLVLRAAGDDLDRRIIALLSRGLEQGEIAARVGRSQSAVSRRIDKMLRRIREAQALARV